MSNMFNKAEDVLEQVQSPVASNTSASSGLLGLDDHSVPVPDGFNAAQKIINNSGVDLMVLDTVASSDTAKEVLFEQTLTPLADTTGSKIIKAGATATFVLNDSYYDTDDKEWEYSYGYCLMLVRADNLFPVQAANVTANFDKYTYDDITVSAGTATTAGDYQNMQDNQKFQQNLMAFPDSPVAKAFADAGSDSLNTANSAGDIDTAVDAFFAKTDSYKNVTLNSVTAIQTYWAAFPFIWAGYAASKSYYLYTSDGSAVSYVGSLDITAPTTAPASVDKTALTGFTLSFSPANGSAKKILKYVSGQFVDSTEIPTVALKGLYQLQSQFTNDPADNKILAYMTGSVNGSKVIGYNEKLKQNADGTWSGFYSMLHPKDAAGWLALVLEFGAIVMTLEMFSRPLKYLYDKFKESRAKNKGEEPSKAEADKIRDRCPGQANTGQRRCATHHGQDGDRHHHQD